MSTQKEEVTSLFEACQPRSDVLDGTLKAEQFAANLATVAHERDEAAPMYRDAAEFFDTTYPTEGLTTLLSNLSGRFLAAADRETLPSQRKRVRIPSQRASRISTKESV
jgi:hypothetical protein